MASATLLETAAQHAWILPPIAATKGLAPLSSELLNPAQCSVSHSVTVSAPLYASSCAVSALDINVYRTNKHRRTVWEMNASELWNCPVTGCRKRYRKTSSKSIDSHKKNCTFLKNAHHENLNSCSIPTANSKDEVKMEEVPCDNAQSQTQTIVAANRVEQNHGLQPVMAVIVEKQTHAQTAKSCDSNASMSSGAMSSTHAPLALVQHFSTTLPSSSSSSHSSPFYLQTVPMAISSTSSVCDNDSIDPIATLLALAHQPSPLNFSSSYSSTCTAAAASSLSSSSTAGAASPSPSPSASSAPVSPVSPPAQLECFEGGVVDDDETESDSELEDLPDRHRRKRQRRGRSPSPASVCAIRSVVSASFSEAESKSHSHSYRLFPFSSKHGKLLSFSSADRQQMKSDGLDSVVVAAHAALHLSFSGSASPSSAVPVRYNRSRRD